MVTIPACDQKLRQRGIRAAVGPVEVDDEYSRNLVSRWKPSIIRTVPDWTA